MRYRNIFWGVILILIGILFTLENLNVIYFNVRELWRLWPVVLILWGISILPADKWIRIGLVLLVLAGSVFFMLDQTVEWENNDMEMVDWPKVDSNRYQQDFDITNEDSIEYATLNLEAAAGSFMLRDTTESMLQFSQNSTGIQYKYFVRNAENRTKINIEPAEGNIKLSKNSESKVKIKLNTAPLWDINLDAGAAAIKFDLSPFKVEKLDVEVGAASVKLKLGDHHPETKINIDAGASEIVLEIPTESGCDIEASTLFSGKHINGFDKIDHGHYQTPNFNTAANKIYVEMNAAVSSYTIIRY